MTLTYLYKKVQEYGLSQNEAEIYLKLYQSGPSLIVTIEKATQIPRTTLVENLERLMKKDLVYRIVKGSRKLYVAEDPVKLKKILINKQVELESKLNEISSTMANFQELLKGFHQVVLQTDQSDVEVRYYEGIDKLKNVYESTLTEPYVYSIANLENYYEVFPDGLGLFPKAMERNVDRQVKDIVFDSKTARKITQGKLIQRKYHGYQVKYIPSSIDFSGFDFLIYSDKVVIVRLDPKKPAAIVVNSSVISTGMVLVHQTLWQLLP